MNYYTDVLKKYAVFEGRAARKEFWMFVLCNLIVSIAVSIIGSIIDFKMLVNLYSLAVFLPNLAVAARRLHDTGRSAWWLLLCFVPIIGWIALIVFYVLDGQAGDNEYGPNPKGVNIGTPMTPPTPAV
jgi:uncharacterized membrane protein YhaH (DUF805 family)